MAKIIDLDKVRAGVTAEPEPAPSIPGEPVGYDASCTIDHACNGPNDGYCSFADYVCGGTDTPCNFIDWGCGGSSNK